MAGHSKWSQIKRKKGANDKKRSAMYSKHIRAIGAAVRSGGGGDPAGVGEDAALRNGLAPSGMGPQAAQPLGAPSFEPRPDHRPMMARVRPR